MRVHGNIVDSVGETPLVKLDRITEGAEATVLAKMESRNPLGSVKDRIAAAMIEAAEKDGRLKPGGLIIEPTSGNTGVGLAFVAAAKGYRVMLTMPESMSVERRQLLTFLGAELVLTPAEGGMPGAIEKAEALMAEHTDAFLPQQFKNPANPEAHYTTTGPEIWEATQGRVDVFVAGVGTGGTITGVGRFLKEKNPDLEVVAVEPAGSAVLSGGSPGPHKIQGIGAGFVPEVLDRTLIDQVLTITEEQAGSMARTLARQEGILCGISAGGNVFAAVELAKKPDYAGKTIVTVVCDTGERYLSTWLFQDNDS